jgi:hypothetical protein
MGILESYVTSIHRISQQMDHTSCQYSANIEVILTYNILNLSVYYLDSVIPPPADYVVHKRTL